MKCHLRIASVNVVNDATGNFDENDLLPVPRHVTVVSLASLILRDQIDVDLEVPKEREYIIDILEEELHLKVKNRKITVNKAMLARDTGNDTLPGASLDKVPDDEVHLFNEQGYCLIAGQQGITIASEAPAGIFYGIMTLLQLLDVDGSLPVVQVIDWPSMEIRGVSDENARGQAGSILGLKRLARFLGLLKMNTLHMNLEDMFRSKKHPKSTDDERGCYSIEEMQDLSEYAWRYFVEVTPVQSTCGHLDNLFVLPEYKHLAEYENVAMCFDISNEDIYPYIKDIIIEEIDAWHKSPSFHMACDESWDVGKGRSRDFVRGKGIGKAYLDHYTRCYEIIKAELERKHGAGNFKIFIYQDILIHHEDVLRGLPRENLVIDIWRYSPVEEYKQVDTIIGHGIEFIVSPSVEDYQRIFPSYNASEKNIINIIKYGYVKSRELGAARLFKGQVNTSWGDFRSENMRELRVYGYALGGTVSWNVHPWLGFSNKVHGSYPALLSFKKAFYTHVFHLDDIPGALELDMVLHGTESNPDFKPWLGSRLLQPKLWTHPLHPVKKEKTTGFPRAIATYKVAAASSRQLAASCSDHAWYFESVALGLDLIVLYCNKVLLKEKLERTIPAKLHQSSKDALIHDITSFMKDVEHAKQAYRHIWELNSKPAGSYGFLLNQYDSMILFYNEIIACVKDGEPFPDPFIPSEYIYSKAIGDFDVPVIFSKRFSIERMPSKAFLQAFAYNHAEITINGKAIGHVEHRNSLSYMILEHCVKFWNVTGFLEAGSNEIKVSITNNVKSWFVLNALLELHFPGGKTDHVITDKTWTWQHSTAGSPCLPVKTLGPPPSVVGGLTRPDFAAGRRSHFTRWLGSALLVPSALPRWAGSLVGFLIWLAKRVKITL